MLGSAVPAPDDDIARVPPALIGFLLLLAAALAIIFYVAAQVVHTP